MQKPHMNGQKSTRQLCSSACACNAHARAEFIDGNMCVCVCGNVGRCGVLMSDEVTHVIGVNLISAHLERAQ